MAAQGSTQPTEPEPAPQQGAPKQAPAQAAQVAPAPPQPPSSARSAPLRAPVRRKVDNPLALAVLATLHEAPNHPYGMARVLRSRGKELSIRINYGSLYTVVRNLEKHGFIEAEGTERAGLRPERTVYRITGPGAAELRDWMTELLGVREKEYPKFEAALALAGVLPPDDVIALLEQRLAALSRDNAEDRAAMLRHRAVLPRIFLVEGEYALALAEAEEAFLRGLVQDMRDGTLDGMDGWRAVHESGQVPEDWAKYDALSREALDEADARGNSGPAGSAGAP